MLDDKICEFQKKLEILETRIYALEAEAKEKLKLGNREGAKKILLKHKKIFDQKKQIEDTQAKTEEQKMILETSLTRRSPSWVRCGNPASKECNKDMYKEDFEYMKNNRQEIKPSQEEINAFFNGDDSDNKYINDMLEKLERELAGNDKPINESEQTEEELLNEFLNFDSEPKKIKGENRRKKKF